MESEQQRAERDQDQHHQDRDACDDVVSGLIRRVRRLAKLSQRELAEDLGVSQSAVARWETGRSSPSARLLAKVLHVAGLELVAASSDGARVEPMRAVAARDAAGRRYPAHTFVWAEGWWAPEGAESTAWFDQIVLRSRDLGMPKVRYSRWWQLARPPSDADVQDHPTLSELVGEARQGWSPVRRRPLTIPSWALEDSRRSRNRWPEEFRSSTSPPVPRPRAPLQPLVTGPGRG